MLEDKQYDRVSVLKRANIFGDKCVSHTVIFADGTRKTLGVFLPGIMTLPSVVDEVIEVLAGHCLVRQKDSTEWTEHRAGDSFEVPGNSAIEIKVFEAVEYICNYYD
ncbi:UNVERIFIED_ORG: uncharacterized protein YaiE (UPF0345 family) [Paraburkholderia sediminicola]|nr:uncharacterized protein YaiE (UPF0345 family) [Paraburkholderia sediminicola]